MLQRILHAYEIQLAQELEEKVFRSKKHFHLSGFVNK